MGQENRLSCGYTDNSTTEGKFLENEIKGLLNWLNKLKLSICVLSTPTLINIISLVIFNVHLTGSSFQKQIMKRIKLSTNFTVFLLFFGVATLEAFQTQNWLKAIFWVAIGIVFLVADNLKKA